MRLVHFLREDSEEVPQSSILDLDPVDVVGCLL